MVGLADGRGEATDVSMAAQYRHGAKALITTDDAVLLVKEYHSDGTPFWTFPGGGVRPEESLTDALYRELEEELNCHEVVIGDQTGHVCYAHHSCSGIVSLYTVFECQPLSEPTPNGAEGVAASRWVRSDALPHNTLPQVESMFRAASSPL
jgi:8-oxo-dGTP diphosphatase